MRRLLRRLWRTLTGRRPAIPFRAQTSFASWGSSKRPDSDRILLEQHRLRLLETIDEVRADRVRAVLRSNPGPARDEAIADIDDDLMALGQRVADIESELEKYLGD